jgi:integrase
MKVTIEKHDGRLRLRWKYQDHRYTMALGIANTPTGQAVAKRKAAEIEIDISAGYFDRTLLKYKPQLLGKNATLTSTFELFNKFSQHKLKNEGVSPIPAKIHLVLFATELKTKIVVSMTK